jgi:hypothetical protein
MGKLLSLRRDSRGSEGPSDLATGNIHTLQGSNEPSTRKDRGDTAPLSAYQHGQWLCVSNLKYTEQGSADSCAQLPLHVQGIQARL